ncbi:MAG: GNAT family N-acetyltransferase [Chitinophagaceae bacterium]
MIETTFAALDFSENYILEDDCVLLRPLEEDDCDNLLEFSLNEPDTWKFGIITAAGEENLKNYIKDALKGRNDKHSYPFIVFDKTSNKYAGSTRFYDIKNNFRTTQLGYTWYGEKFRGTSLNKRCKKLLLEFAFEKMNFLRVEFRADVLNERSVAAMKSIGCVVEGILRQDVPKINGERRTSIILSILQNEWHTSVKQNIIDQINKIGNK